MNMRKAARLGIEACSLAFWSIREMSSYPSVSKEPGGFRR
jgi:hypothetical protein